MSALAGTPFELHEAHYVIFRLRGPICALPATVRLGRFAIYPHTIDLGESTDSGSRQPKPSVINIEDIVAAVSSPSESGTEEPSDESGNATPDAT